LAGFEDGILKVGKSGKKRGLKTGFGRISRWNFEGRKKWEKAEFESGIW
jgi:hypothetical protein